MGLLTILLLIGGALSGLTGLGAPEPEEDLLRAKSGPDPDPGKVRVGTDDADLLESGDGADWLLGFAGDDVLEGGAGDDVLIGGTGMDVILAGDGDDFVESANIVAEPALRTSAEAGGDVADVVFAYDLPRGSDESDTVTLGAGDDTVVAGSDDVVTGGAGQDAFALGDWITGGQPVEITDFDEAEDIVSFVYDRDGDMPDLEIQRNSQTGLTTIRADGQSIAVLRGASPEFSLLNVVVGRYAA